LVIEASDHSLGVVLPSRTTLLLRSGTCIVGTVEVLELVVVPVPLITKELATSNEKIIPDNVLGGIAFPTSKELNGDV